jgi:RNA polymerase sigma-32 factor
MNSKQLRLYADLAPVSNIDVYMHQAGKIPMLTLEEEQQYARELRDNNDLDAAKQLILPHLRYVIKVAKGYAGYGLAVADLIQEGNIGLMKAVKRFDPDMGVRLVSFAVHWIKAEIHEFILKNWRIVKVATTKAQRKLFFNLRKMKKRLGWFSHQEVNDVASDLGVEPKTVLEMEQRLNAMDASFDGHQDSQPSETFTPSEYLEDTAANPELLVAADSHSTQQKAALFSALAELNDRERAIVQARWLDDNNKSTLHELAAEFGVSAERIRQIEKMAFQKIKTLIGTAAA